MNRTRLLVTLGVLASAAGIFGCGGGGDVSVTTQALSQRTVPVAPRPAPTPPSPLGKIGKPVRIAANSPGGRKLTLVVTVTRIRNKLAATPYQRSLLADRWHYAGVSLSIKNLGPSTWSGSPASSSALITNTATQAVLGATAGDCGGPFAQRAEVRPKSRQRGCIVFVLKPGEKPAAYQFAPGFPTAEGVQWNVRR